ARRTLGTAALAVTLIPALLMCFTAEAGEFRLIIPGDFPVIAHELFPRVPFGLLVGLLLTARRTRIRPLPPRILVLTRIDVLAFLPERPFAQIGGCVFAGQILGRAELDLSAQVAQVQRRPILNCARAIAPAPFQMHRPQRNL